MSLVASVQARYSAQLLLSLTNPQDSTATVEGAARLALAATDVEAAFKVYAGAAYDDADPTHVSLAVEGVLVKLRVYLGQTKAEEQYTAWTKRLDDLRKIGANDRILPVSSSVLEPASESRDGETVRPWSDIGVFDHLVPDPPGGSSDLPGTDD